MLAGLIYGTEKQNLEPRLLRFPYFSDSKLTRHKNAIMIPLMLLELLIIYKHSNRFEGT